jgi:uncharacterized protein YfaA (DUF2138 family)
VACSSAATAEASLRRFPALVAVFVGDHLVPGYIEDVPVVNLLAREEAFRKLEDAARERE